MWEVVDRLTDVIDMLAHPRFYIPLLAGVSVAFASWKGKPLGSFSEVLALGAILAGLVIGFWWDWGR